MNSPENQKTIQKKVVVSACFGTFLEWYDFLTFASQATYFSVLFFPSDDPVAALLASLGTFGIVMIVRPLGAPIFGSLGDRHGRRTIFLATIVLMGVSTVLVGLLPTKYFMIFSAFVPPPVANMAALIITAKIPFNTDKGIGNYLLLLREILTMKKILLSGFILSRFW